VFGRLASSFFAQNFAYSEGACMTSRDQYDTGDWRIDAYRSWELAIAELRKRGIRNGTIKPETEEERTLARECQSTEDRAG
jgi:hypothetical protein